MPALLGLSAKSTCPTMYHELRVAPIVTTPPFFSRA